MGMQTIKEENGRLMSISTQERQVLRGVQLRLVKLLAVRQSYPKEMSKELKLHEQKVYYHMRQLEKKGFVRVARKEERGGALAKLYELSSPAFIMRFGDFQEVKRIPARSEFSPFIRNGNLDAKIIVGSPDPHGPEKARSRDVTFAVDLALFLGTFLTKTEGPAVVEDKDVRAHDLDSNLIIIGGPVTNKVTKMVNEKLPVKFDGKKNIISHKKAYKQDDCGFIARAENPFNKSKNIIVIAGKRYGGTKAAVIAFTQKFDDIKKRNFTVVEGLDNDGDGEIDGVRILE